MKTALVLSGGGANGAFQAGAIASLLEKGFDFDVVSGVSVGSLNGAMVAQKSYDALLSVWKTVTQQQVYRKRSLLSMAAHLLTGGLGIYDGTPMLDLIREHISLANIRVPYYLGMTSLYTQQYYSLKHSSFVDDQDFQGAIHASSLMPGIWDPVNVDSMFDDFLQCCDGGVKHITPLADVLQELPDRIIIIGTHTEGVPAPLKVKNIIGELTTILDMFLAGIIQNDTENILRINQLVLQAQKGGVALVNPKSGREYKYFETTVIVPESPLGDPIDFSRQHLDAAFAAGTLAGKNAK